MKESSASYCSAAEMLWLVFVGQAIVFGCQVASRIGEKDSLQHKRLARTTWISCDTLH